MSNKFSYSLMVLHVLRSFILVNLINLVKIVVRDNIQNEVLNSSQSASMVEFSFEDVPSK